MKLTLSAIVIAAGLAIPGITLAQDLPKAVSDLGLSNIEIREKPRAEYGRRIRATLPSNAKVEIELDGKDAIEDIESRGNDLFPIADIRSLVPAPILENKQWPADARLEKIEFERDGRIEIEGRLADGQEFDAEFSADGRTLDFDIDD
ncbi:PepSY domain-containing protein [Pusillimonas sp. MFBS29]|uniref:PepSY domain-containing protein n=1 Tax=Pusillimonas sp. MFBS29 TaxID=2886690 RepID=UPI001D11AB12|nr:PepSY domain-containing protein [Pusillimonas sp. MFBS29]MCC2597517.1 PepSY domain-containing protein [Pusillimonas sp. MFBS29]